MTPTLRYLSEADVVAASPATAETIDLAATALRALADGTAQLPPKHRLHHRTDPPAHSYAMPAYSPVGDLLGLKWVTSAHGNAEHDLPVVNGTVTLVDADTGLCRCVMGARWLTGLRTAAVSGACLALAPPEPGVVALLGTGLQAHTHLAVLDTVGLHDVRVWGRRAESVDRLVEWAGEHVPAVRLRPAATIPEALDGAGVVITGVTQGVETARIDDAWLRPDALLLPLDYGTCVQGALADGRTLAADDPAQFVAVRDAGGSTLDGYRDPDAASGALLGRLRPDGAIIVQNIGNGVCDLFIAEAVLRRAEALGRGHELPL